MAYPALIRALETLAAPVIKAYQDDLTVHDAATLNGAKVGDVFLWAPREHGTHLITLARADVANIRAREHYDAVQAIGAPPIWYLIAISRARTVGANAWVDTWTVTPCTDHAETVARWHEGARAEPAPVRELHL